MKLFKSVSIPALLSFVILLQGCTRDQCTITRTYTKFTPVYMSYTEFRDAVKSETPRDLKKPGKIYFKDNLIFVNEYLQGIHIIDNTNPSAPVKLAFLSIPGNIDMAVKGNILYADSYVDLVAIDISNPSNAVVTSRIQDMLPYNTWVNGVYVDPQLGVVKEWLEERVTETTVGDCYRGGGGPMLEDRANTTTGGFGGGGGGGNGTGSAPMPSVGTGGSMARFAIYQDYLYVVDNQNLNLVNISDPAYPGRQGNPINLGWGIETIFPYKDHLFIGSSSGMFIYNNTNPASPIEVSSLEHVTSCDPVVAEDNRAYVTLRNGTRCFGYTNELDIIDITALSSPVQITKHDMFNPHGLGVDSKTVFISDGDAGLKVFDANDPYNLKSLAAYPNIHSFDVIPLASKKVLLMIGEDGFYQYDYSDLNNIRLLSTIAVAK